VCSELEACCAVTVGNGGWSLHPIIDCGIVKLPDSFSSRSPFVLVFIAFIHSTHRKYNISTNALTFERPETGDFVSWQAVCKLAHCTHKMSLDTRTVQKA
jgi:hypothetical protein